MDGFQRKLTYKEKEEFVFSKFPKIRQEVETLKFKVELDNQIKERINGRIIMQLVPSAQGQRVGEYINAIKELRPDLYSAQVLNYTEEEIHLGILTAIADYKKELRDQKNVQSNE